MPWRPPARSVRSPSSLPRTIVERMPITTCLLESGRLRRRSGAPRLTATVLALGRVARDRRLVGRVEEGRRDQVVRGGTVARDRGVPDHGDAEQAFTSGSWGCGSSGSQKKTRRSTKPSVMRAPSCWSPPSGPLRRQTTGRPSSSCTIRPVLPVASRSWPARTSRSVPRPLEQVGFLAVVSDEGHAPCRRRGVEFVRQSESPSHLRPPMRLTVWVVRGWPWSRR